MNGLRKDFIFTGKPRHDYIEQYRTCKTVLIFPVISDIQRTFPELM